MKPRFSDDTVQKILDARECLCDREYGLTYQKCRFCGAGWPEEYVLWKYAVRHYACTKCRDAARKQRTELLKAIKRNMPKYGSTEL